MSTSMSGRTVLLTGASSGIGRATALELGRRGASLVLVCRDRGRGEETVAAIAAETGHRDVTLMLADLSSQESIRRLASDFLASGRPLHVLLNNAGVVNTTRTVTADGIETTFAVNHLAYFLLTQLLLERLAQSAPARVVNVASEAHKFGRLDFDDLQAEKSYSTMRVYGQSKMANILFTYELARRLAGTGVTANCLHPGAVATGLGRNNGAVANFFIRVLAPFFRTPANGAATSIHLATAPELEAVTGRYFSNSKDTRTSKPSYDEADARRLWTLSERLTGLTPAV
jgi:retinol dehydrogenase 14